jgi:hypothetical protein
VGVEPNFGPFPVPATLVVPTNAIAPWPLIFVMPTSAHIFLMTIVSYVSAAEELAIRGLNRLLRGDRWVLFKIKKTFLT